jgi:hypothetical protein
MDPPHSRRGEIAEGLAHGRQMLCKHARVHFFGKDIVETRTVQAFTEPKMVLRQSSMASELEREAHEQLWQRGRPVSAPLSAATAPNASNPFQQNAG